MIWHNADEVEYIFGLTFTADQREMVTNYIVTGTRPPAGCYVCSEGYIRALTGRMDAYELDVQRGDEKWPWDETGMLNLAFAATLASEELKKLGEAIGKYSGKASITHRG